ncbi:hypothetical protein MPH_03048 [Macrophomina phaseolina MS6]|uniref:Uncharacterized protein n=1 Tax=Macrophomina phaseolina (strain MS6) TaxID=1126212 RepID=K2S3R4_MACPH|nr:hypothetical protein MPH_03048 [Macrophomina phaseolina MS6]
MLSICARYLDRPEGLLALIIVGIFKPLKEFKKVSTTFIKRPVFSYLTVRYAVSRTLAMRWHRSSRIFLPGVPAANKPDEFFGCSRLSSIWGWLPSRYIDRAEDLRCCDQGVRQRCGGGVQSGPEWPCCLQFQPMEVGRAKSRPQSSCAVLENGGAVVIPAADARFRGSGRTEN